jgi:translation initiation factor IF-1
MLFREIIVVYCENIRNTQIHCVGRMQSSVRTSQETHYVSITKPNRLMLFRKIIAVYCENRTEHTNRLCWQNEELFNVKVSGTYSYQCVYSVKSRKSIWIPSSLIQ